jgi:small conductance mechanosensitive channel
MESFDKTIEVINEKLDAWGESIVAHVPNFLLAILCFIGFVILAKISKKGLKKVLERYNFGVSLVNLLVALMGFTISTLGLFVSLEILDLGKAVTSLLAGIGVLGLALGFAFQEIAANMISGVILAFDSPMNEGDMIEAHGYIGTVEHIGLRSTTIISPQGQNIQVPNRMIFQNPFKNYTITGMRRIDLQCGISYGDDLQKVEDLVLVTVRGLEGIIKEGEHTPFFFYEGFGDSSINFQVSIWLNDPSQSHYLNVRSLAIKELKLAFDANGVTIPFPIRTLDFGIKGGEPLSNMLKS